MSVWNCLCQFYAKNRLFCGQNDSGGVTRKLTKGPVSIFLATEQDCLGGTGSAGVPPAEPRGIPGFLFSYDAAAGTAALPVAISCRKNKKAGNCYHGKISR